MDETTAPAVVTSVTSMSSFSRTGRKLSLGKHVLETRSCSELDPIKIEDIYTEIGGFGRFQAVLTLMMCLPEIPSAMVAVIPVFVSSTNVHFSCFMNDTSGHFYKKVLPASNALLCSKNCSSILPFAIQHTSIVEEWNLVCDQAWLNDAITSIQMLGMMAGSFIASILADKYGRKHLLYLMILMSGAFGVGSGIVTTEYLYAVMRFFAGFGVGGFYVVYSIYLIEFLTPSWRTICGTVSIWFMGEMLLTLAAYFILPWRLLTIVTSATAFLVFLYYPFIPESPRFLLCKGRTEEAKKVFKQIANWNSKSPVDGNVIDKLQEAVTQEEAASDEALGSTPAFFTTFTSSKIRLQLLLFLLAWFSVAFIYYGITFNTKNLSGDPYLNVLYMALVDMSAFPSGAIFNNCLGRKRTFSYCMIIGAIFLITLVIVEQIFGLNTYPIAITILCYLGRFFIGAGWGVIFCFTAESFPTIIRSTCVGLCSLAGNIGGVLAPLLAFLGVVSPSLPYFIFCGVTVIAAASSCLLTETNGKPLKNFIQ